MKKPALAMNQAESKKGDIDYEQKTGNANKGNTSTR